MRKHGWQLPYHPLQMVAVAVFLALGFAFYVFFAPFVGKKLYQYVIIGVYTPLIVCVFGLYISCAAADPAEPGVFKSKKYLKTSGKGEHAKAKDSKLAREINSSKQHVNAEGKGDKSIDGNVHSAPVNAKDSDAEKEQRIQSSHYSSCILGILFFPCTFLYNCISPSKDSSERQTSEDGMFYCSLCEVEVSTYSKHCRVCDKCVDHFDHHCRWVNNCIGKRNYRQFFTLMIVAILLLILQWSTGILVLVRSFLEHKRYSEDIVSTLGSSFSMVPFVIVVAMCTILAMLATLPLAQLFFFHILLIKKGISTYDYIVALREQEQQEVGGGQSPQMSQVSSFTGLSSASSFNTFRRGAWCTPPRLFVEDQFDVVLPDNGSSVSSYGKKTAVEEPTKKKNLTVRISPWTLARLNAEEVSKAASEAKKKSKILQPVALRREEGRLNLERDHHNSRRRTSKRIRLPTDFPIEPPVNFRANKSANSSSGLAPLQWEARSAFRTNLGSSPESSLSVGGGVHVACSTSDGYEASGGEDSDQVPSRLFFESKTDRGIRSLKAISSEEFSQGVRKC